MLVSAVPPFMLRTKDNPEGVPIDVFDGLRKDSLADRSQFYRDLADGPFFGNNRRGVEIARGPRDALWRQGLEAGHRNAYESIDAFSATDFREDLANFDVPTLVIHGDDDQIVSYEVGGKASAALIDGAQLITYEGGPHGYRHPQGAAERGPAGLSHAPPERRPPTGQLRSRLPIAISRFRFVRQSEL